MNINNLAFFLFSFILFGGCQQRKPISDSSIYFSNSWIHQLNQQLTEAIVQDGFSPPVASRIYAYTNIAGYEAIVEGNDSLISLANQLNDLTTTASYEQDKSYDHRVSMIVAFHDVAVKMVYRDYIIDSSQNRLLRKLKSEKNNTAVFERSVNYGKSVAEIINKWASEDGYKKTRNAPRYKPSKEAGHWVPTPPTYGESLEPHWHKLRPFVMDSVGQFSLFPPPIPYSADTNSDFYKLAKEVYDVSQILTDEHFAIAKHWDCNPQVSVNEGHLMGLKRQLTPGGHWVGITRLASNLEHKNLFETAETYMLITITMADAFLSAWHEKYRSDLIRPETYINQYIDPNWRPILETPLFPEHISAHSAISRSAATILTAQFGEDFAFVDSVEVPFGLPPREFSSFYQASNEAAISRTYGGIHYAPGRELGIEQGKLLGAYVFSQLKTRQK